MKNLVTLGSLGAETPLQQLATVWKSIEDITWIWSNGVTHWYGDEKSVAYNIGAMADTNPDAYTQIKPLYDQTLAALVQFRGYYLKTQQPGGPAITDALAADLIDAGTKLESAMQAVRTEADAGNPGSVLTFLRGALELTIYMVGAIAELFAKIGSAVLNTMDFGLKNMIPLVLAGLFLWFVAPKLAAGYSSGRNSRESK